MAGRSLNFVSNVKMTLAIDDMAIFADKDEEYVTILIFLEIPGRLIHFRFRSR